MRGVLASEIDGPLLAYLEAQVFDLDATREAIAEERDRRLVESQALIAQADAAAGQADADLARVKADYRAGRISAEDWSELRAEIEADRSASEAEAAQLRRRAEEIEREAQALGVEDELAKRLAELRLAVAGEVTSAESLEAIRSALSRVFDHVALVATEDGLVLVPQVRVPAAVTSWVAAEDGALVQQQPEPTALPRGATAGTCSSSSSDERMVTARS
jgi:hypothetical protein